MPAPIFPVVPVLPWKLYSDVFEIPKAGFKGIEVEAIAVEKDPGGRVFCARVICSPEDGPLQMCSVYLREEGGGALCIADLPSKEEAFAYAAAVSQARGWQVHGSIWDLRIREVPGKGYVADPRLNEQFTLDPAKAALYHASIAKEDLFVGGPGEHGRWLAWFDASNHAVDRAAEKEALLTRVFNAAVGAMGASAPDHGSFEATRMREMLKDMVEANRSDRLVIFDDAHREVVFEALDGVTGHEADEKLCELILSASPGDLFDGMNPDFEVRLLSAFASASGKVALDSAVAGGAPTHLESMLWAIHTRMLERLGESPFVSWFAESAEVALAAHAPRG